MIVQLETALAKHPGVLAATVIPDERFNEVVAAVSCSKTNGNEKKI
jgi:acyl-CoA synthetase (AMP-forming)/AMP-acid ligase II